LGGQAGGGEGRSGYSTKNKNPTRQCGEQQTKKTKPPLHSQQVKDNIKNKAVDLNKDNSMFYTIYLIKVSLEIC
jgi:hypothetical protein